MISKAKLRRQVISGNRESLYLDWYPPIRHPESGKVTRREFLNLFVFSETEHDEIEYTDRKGIHRKKIIKVYTKSSTGKLKQDPKRRNLNLLDKQHNKNTLALAELIRQKRENEVNKFEIYTPFELQQIELIKLREQSFIQYYQKLTDKRQDKNRLIWLASLKYFKQFIGNDKDIRFNEINEVLCNNYRDYLSTAMKIKNNERALHQNTKVSYFNKLKCVLKSAFKEGYFQVDISARIETLKEEEVIKDFLSLEELGKLVKTECEDPLLKRAALLSALTGLRFSDIHKLTWNEIKYIEGDGYYIHFRQKKTHKVEMLPISDQAFSLMGDPRDPDEKIFEGLQYSSYTNKNLYMWIAAAGISGKKIGFHNFRHTHGTLQHSLGSDIHTIQKLLGHKNIKTTEIYAQVLDPVKREAVNRIKIEGL